MDGSVLRSLKDSISQQRRNLVEWLNGTAPTVQQLRSGPAGIHAIEDHLHVLDTALKKADDETLGLCTVCNDYIETSRLEMDYTACVCLEHLTGEERSRLESDLELSQKVQQALLPQATPRIQGVEIAAYSQPARIVGGDYFDFVRMKSGLHAIVIADVMGKGMPASMLMASLQASLRIIAPESTQPAEVVARLNQLFCHNIRLTKFVTVFLGAYDERTRTLTYANAGHNPPLIHRVNGTIEPLLPTGAAIGLIEQATFEQAAVVLHDGDRVLLYTDGVVESMNGCTEQFGQERLEQLLREQPGVPSRELIGTLKQRLQAFSGTPSPADDTTVIVMRVT